MTADKREKVLEIIGDISDHAMDELLEFLIHLEFKEKFPQLRPGPEASGAHHWLAEPEPWRDVEMGI
ncbi:MAG: hypothetical protein HC880_18665 [Bacteroidia bacterium]|nr:hypothetical protein [Bacteroidia bacterium]